MPESISISLMMSMAGGLMVARAQTQEYERLALARQRHASRVTPDNHLDIEMPFLHATLLYFCLIFQVMPFMYS